VIHASNLLSRESTLYSLTFHNQGKRSHGLENPSSTWGEAGECFCSSPSSRFGREIC